MIITNRKIKERIYMQKQTTRITINLRKEQIANHCPLITLIQMPRKQHGKGTLRGQGGLQVVSDGGD